MSSSKRNNRGMTRWVEAETAIRKKRERRLLHEAAMRRRRQQRLEAPKGEK
jgi:hypothetical protein